MTQETFDLLVIGSGPGGYRAAVLGAQRGLSVAIAEGATWGGTCLNRGCVPKKDWHATAKLVRDSAKFSERGLQVGEVKGDMAQAWRHQKKVVETVRESYVDYLKRLGVKRLQGFARFIDSERVEVAGETVSAKHFIVATGSSPHVPEGLNTIPGRLITSDTLFDSEPPQGNRVAILGGGVVGIEFAFIFKMLGKDVEWVAGSRLHIQDRFSPQALGILKGAMKECGVEARVKCHATAAEEVNGALRLQLSSGEALTVDWAVLGTGRVPNTEGLAPENAGVKVDGKGFVSVNGHLQTSKEHIYAIGDVVGPWMTANQALADATIAVNNIVDGLSCERNIYWVPELVYSAVELARVGMNDDVAEDEGHEPAVGFAAFETSPRALAQDDYEGYVRLLADMDSGELLGGEIVGAEAGELIHLLSLAPDRATALKWIASGKFNHPARAEEVVNAVEGLAARWGLADRVF